MSLDLSAQRESGRRTIVRLAIGFLAVVLTMAVVALVSQINMKTMHQYVVEFIGVKNEKVALTQTMANVVRERMILLGQIVLEDDAFRRDELAQHFYGLSAGFIEARRRLEAMTATAREKENIAKLGYLVKDVTELHGKVVDLAQREQHEEAKRMLMEQSIPVQQGVMDHINRMLAYHQQEAERIQKTELKSYERGSFVVIILSGLAASFGWIVAIKTLDGAWRDRMALLDEIDRRARVEQDLVHAKDNLENQVQERTADLKQTAALLEEAQHVAGIGHFDWRIKEDNLFWSQEACRMLRLPPEQHAGWGTLMSLVHTDDRTAVESALYKALYEKKHYDVEHRIVLPNGLVRTVYQQGEVTRDSEDRPVRMLGTLQDVTDRKVVEQKLRLAASVYENAGEGIMITDAENNIVDVNEAFTAITGFERQEVLGQNPRLFKSGKHDASFYREMWGMLMEKGYWHGEIWAKTKSGEIFPKWQTVSVIRDENGTITNYIAIFRDISDTKKNEEKLWKLAHFDNLTGVANRSLMYANLRLAASQAKRENLQVAMMLFDLDGFKQINDTLGHDVGDRLLKHVARQLTLTVREVDTVARLGGDEFTVILANIRRHEDVAYIGKKIQAALAQPLKLESGQEIIARASIGIALYPADAEDLEALMKNADRAMYHAKELGKNNFQFFAEGMSSEIKPGSPTA